MRWSTVARLAVVLVASTAAVSSLWTDPPGGAGGDAGDEPGALYRLSLRSAPFPHPDRENGYTYDQVDYPAESHYQSSSVAVFVPSGFRSTGPTDLVLFLHGWFSSIDDAEQRFDLYRQFAASRVQALLVVPELALNAPDSFGGKLEDKGGFARFVDELLGQLAARGVIRSRAVGRIVLAGHSGAFEAIGAILRNGDLAVSIKEVVIFDGLYAYTNQFRRWIEDSAGTFVTVMAADGEETTSVDALMDLLRGDGVAFRAAPDDPQDDAEDLASRVVFLKSSSDHYGVVSGREELRRILSASPVLTR